MRLKKLKVQALTLKTSRMNLQHQQIILISMMVYILNHMLLSG